MNNSREKNKNQWFLLINGGKGRLWCIPRNLKSLDSSKTDFKVTKPKLVFTGISLKIHYDTERQKNSHCSCWDTKVVLSLCAYKSQMYFLFLLGSILKRNLRLPSLILQAKKTTLSKFWRAFASYTSLIVSSWKILCLPSFAWHVNTVTQCNSVFYSSAQLIVKTPSSFNKENIMKFFRMNKDIWISQVLQSTMCSSSI